MPRVKKPSGLSVSKPVPAATPEDREAQLMQLATNAVEQRIIDGTASSQELIYILKRGSRKEQLEIERLKKENELLKAKAEAIQSTRRMEDLYQDVLSAIKSYNGGVFDDTVVQ